MEARQITLEVDEHELYPVHEEDNVPVNPRHFRQQRYLVGVLQALHPELWVTGETCLYWRREGRRSPYVAPDVTVIDCPAPAEPHPVWLKWSDPPLRFVVELGSRSSFIKDTGPKVRRYERDLEVPEYLYADPPKRKIRFWRLRDGTYDDILPAPDGRVYSEQLGVWFGFDSEGFLRVYDAVRGEMPTHEEERERSERLELELSAEHRRAEAERARADVEHERAESEAALRRELEQKLAEMAARLAERNGRNGHGPTP